MHVHVFLLMTFSAFHGALGSQDCCESTVVYFSTRKYIAKIVIGCVKWLLFAEADHDVNISLNGLTDMYVDVYSYTCLAYIGEVSLNIVRNDGELEMYSLTNTTQNRTGFDFGGNIYNSGLSYAGHWEFDILKRCYIRVMIHPMDLQYDGAEITLLVSLPECYITPKTSKVTALHIQG